MEWSGQLCAWRCATNRDSAHALLRSRLQHRCGHARSRTASIFKTAMSYTTLGIVRTLTHCCVFTMKPIVNPRQKWRIGFGDSMPWYRSLRVVLGALLNACGCLFLVAVRGRPQGLPDLPWSGSPTRVQLPPHCLATMSGRSSYLHGDHS